MIVNKSFCWLWEVKKISYFTDLGQVKKLVILLPLGKFEIKHKTPLGETECLGNP